jgi:hypothetical protein
MTNRRTVSSALVGLLLMAPVTAALAHHSFAAQYDGKKSTMIEGTVTKVEWMNPHAYFFVDVEDPKTGKVATWSCEMAAPAVLIRSGWTRNALKVGDQVSVAGSLSRDGATALSATSITLSESGKKLFTQERGAAAN